ncbi:MAG TPA: amino acid adenylation domain-containing protein [Pyrinomonadaceae bacterium]|jgi:amino acid adenylation domain-containing protein
MSDLTKILESLSPHKRQLLELMLQEKARKAEAAPQKAAPVEIPRREKFSPGPVSSAQQRLWFIDQLDPGTPAFNIPAAVRLRGPLDVRVLVDCFDEIVRRHETLRTGFASDDGLPVQVIAPSLKFEIPSVDLRHLPEAERAAEVRRLVTAECQRSFDLSRPPLMRATLVTTGEQERVLVLMMHHIIGDVWSVRVVMKELAALYEAFSAGRPSPLPELPIQYCDYATWQREWLRGEALRAQLAYWRGKLDGMPEALELPTDRPRPAVQSVWGAKHFLKIPGGLTAALRALAQEEKASLFMTLLAAWKVLLHRYTGQSDIVVGAPVANRNRSEFEGMVGFFVNSLILRTELSGRPSFRELLRRVRETTLEAFANQDLPFERLVEVLQPARSMSRNPLFQTDFILQNSPRTSYQVTGLTFEALPAENGTAQLDLTLDLWEEPEGIGGWLEYDTDLFDAATAARMVGDYVNLLERLAAEPGRPVAHHSLLCDADLRRVSVEWNDTRRDYDLASAFPRLFEAQAERTPEAVAVACGPRRLTYDELNRRANRLARLLVERGVGAESVVCLLMRRGIDLLTSILAVLKAGGAYLPLDPAHPAQRLRTIGEQSGSRLVIAEREFLPTLEEAWGGAEGIGAPTVLAAEDVLAEGRGDGNLPPRSLPDNLAYVIYTSGSTGVPKGVMIHHRGMVNHLWANIEALSMGASDVLAQTASQCFDISVWQFLAPLIIGGRVHIFPDQVTQDPPRLLQEIDREGVTVFETVPSLLQVALNELKVRGRGRPELKSLRWLLPTGEEVPVALCREWLRTYPGVPLMNAYGPSECSDDVTLEPINEPPDETVTRVSIGRPVGNLRVCIVDRELNPMPVGVPGELCVMGVGVGRGYLGLPARTAAFFVPDPFGMEPGSRLYRSGDRARYLPDGRVEFHGRLDHQVKVRGHRIELGEVESALAALPGVSEAAATLRHDPPGDPRLVGYVVWGGDGEGLGAAEVRERLRRRLPDYMVPAAVVGLERMPLSPNGKIDRKALPAPEATSTNEQVFVGPRTPTEAVLSAIWSEILGAERIGVEDNLFDHGAHSLLVTQVISRVRKAFKVEPPLRTFFECPTVGGMARAIDALLSQAEGIAAPPIVPIERGPDLPLSFTQERMWFLDQLEPGMSAYNVPGAVYLDGRLDVKALEEAFGEVMRRHEILRTTYGTAGGKPVQVINPPETFLLRVEDLQGLPEDERDEAAMRLAKENAQRPFDLATGPMVRCFLVRMAPDRHLLAMTTHHIAYDMWSREIFIFELATLYQSFLKGEPSPLPEPEIQWVDYAYWQRQWLRGEVLERQLDYWRRKLDGAPPHIDLPTDFPRPAVQSYRGARQYLQFPPGLARGLAALSRKHGVTPFITLLAAFKTLLWHYTGQEQIVVGSPIANRNRLEVEKLMGFIANTLTLHTDLSGDPTFPELLGRVRETALGAHAHQDVPFELLVQALQPQRDISRSPLFQVMFNYMMNYSSPRVDLPDLTLRLERLHSGAAQFDINVDMWETPDGLNGVVEYCTDLFRHETITRFITQFRILLEAINADPSLRLSHYPLLNEGERRRLLVEWNDTAVEYRRPHLLHLMFQEQAALTPEATAVVFEGQRLSYAELNTRANRLAHYLIGHGVRPETLVGICAERSFEMVVGLLGVLKAGAAFVPLDPACPWERLARMLDDARVSVLLTQAELSERVSAAAAKVVRLDADWAEIEAESGADPDAPVAEDNLAYLIHTSGPAGQPEGAMNTHRAVCNRLLWMQEQYRLTSADGVMQKTPFGFDASVWEFFWPLVTGARLVVARPGGHRDNSYLAGLIKEQGVTTMHFAPAMLRAFLEEPAAEGCGGLRRVMSSNESLAHDLVEKFDQKLGAKLHVLYAPPEAAADVSFWECEPREGRATLLGRPIANTRLYVLDARMEPVPVGVGGELYVGGVAVGRGYWRGPALTAERFLPDPFATEPGSRLYRSGDRARYLPDGRVEFLGRLDHQVKVRGHRIELGEVESALAALPGVSEAAATLRHDPPGDPRLVGYVVWGEEALPGAEVRERLRRRLPDYMVPAAVVGLEKMPLSPNGKIDRKALPAPETDDLESESIGYAEPQTELEKMVAGCWSELLGVERIGLHDDFFDLGGHSLLAAQFLSRLRDQTGVEVSLKMFFETSTVASAVKAVAAVRWATESMRAGAGEDEESGIISEESVL